MKGNEVRVAFFLHPVDQVRDGMVAKVEPIKNSVGIISLLLLAMLLGLGVLFHLSLTLEVDPIQTEATLRKPRKTTTTTMSHSEARSTKPVTESITEATSEEKKDDETTTEYSPGKIVLLTVRENII